MLNNAIKEKLTEEIQEIEGSSVSIEGSSPVGGGSINDAYHLTTPGRDYFVKVNHADRYPGMFDVEMKGLRLLKDTGELRIPEPYKVGEVGNEAFILMEFLDKGPMDPDFWDGFGRGLARMHRHTSNEFGLDHDNYIGSLPQYNDPEPDWTTFFVKQRLEPQLKMARDAGKMGESESRKFQRLFEDLDRIYPHEPPALVHGDLWSGNYMTGPKGEPSIMDPAVYYGHREMDIGMSRMFGGFDPRFYDSYNSEYPMEEGWEDRIDVSNLYPLMVHVNLFGGGYAMEVNQILQRFT